MANSTLFSSNKKTVSKTNVINNAGGEAYEFEAKHALAQLASTGCFNNTYYTTAEEQLNILLDLVSKVSDNIFLAKLAIYSRNTAYMKDMPAVLLAILSVRNTSLFKLVFNRIIDNGKMLRNFVQIMRSGKIYNRKSLGSAPKKAIQNWLESRKDESLFRDSVGNNPSVADIIKMVHPKPKTKSRSAMYSYLIGKDYVKKDLPDCIKNYEKFKEGKTKEVPDVEFRLLTSLPLTSENWASIAKNAPWHMLRMNLNAFNSHGVFDIPGMVETVSNKLVDEKAILKSKVFPYQLLTAYLSTEDKIPNKIKNALQDAMEIATKNVPPLENKKVFVLVDTSGSMSSPITGRSAVSSKTKCVDVASLIASSLLRVNENTEIIPFDTKVHKSTLNSRDSVITNSSKLATFGGGGTDVACGIEYLNSFNKRGDAIIIVSDNESWFRSSGYYGNSTNTKKEWEKFRKRNPNAKLICIDLVANTTTQAPNDKHTLNIGGFSDNIWPTIESFIMDYDANHWLQEIVSIEL